MQHMQLEEFVMHAAQARPSRVTLVPGNILVLPTAVIVLERTLGERACYGFRLPFLFLHESSQFDASLTHIEKTFPSHPHKPQMLAMQQQYRDHSSMASVVA